MADPVASLVTTGTSTSASPTVSFTAVAAGTLLVLDVVSETTKTGDPSGWSVPTGGAQVTFCAHYRWYKIASGSETSVTYDLNGAYSSCYSLVAVSHVDADSPLDISAGQCAGATTETYATPSVTTSSGRRVAVASRGASTGLRDLTGFGEWTNSYTEVSDVRTSPTSGDQVAVAVACLVLDGGGDTSSQAVTEGNSAQSNTGIISVFRASTTTTPVTYARRIIIG